MGVSTLKTGLATDWRQPLWFLAGFWQPVKDTGQYWSFLQCIVYFTTSLRKAHGIYMSYFSNFTLYPLLTLLIIFETRNEEFLQP